MKRFLFYVKEVGRDGICVVDDTTTVFEAINKAGLKPLPMRDMSMTVDNMWAQMKGTACSVSRFGVQFYECTPM
jgi:hypothetical protein